MDAPRIRELPEKERPREKLAALGANALTDSELIAILLRTGIVGVNAVELARKLIEKFGSLGNLSRASVAELSREKGVGPAKAVQLAAAFGLGTRLSRESLARAPLDTPQLIYDLLGHEMRQLGKESLRIVLLDTKLRLIRVEEISLGTLNECIAHPRDIFRPAIAHNAHAMVLVHNHPSGDPTPSEADRRLTIRLVDAARLLQLTFFDHVIIGAPNAAHASFFSFRAAGLI